MLIKVDHGTSDHKMSHLEGDTHDRCPACAKVVEPTHRLPGGRVIYSDDPRKGGCGAAWSRTPRLAAEEDRRKGVNPKNLTESARANRTVFAPTEKYQSEYQRIFGHS